MIINSSQISMEASSGHKDVSITPAGQILSRNHSGRRDEYFRLKLPIDDTLKQDQYLSRLSGSHQTRWSVDVSTNPGKIFTSEQVVSKMVEELTGTPAVIRAGFPPASLSQLTAVRASAMTTQKRFYRVGGQQFKMTLSAPKVHYEREFFEFSSTGGVTTADGRAINFSLDISVHRTTVVRESVLGRSASGYMIDPLVLNFGQGLDILSEQTFLFDITGDGQNELIPGLRRGSGFLALDRDNDNKITSGLELFGPISGSGFLDLAVHDIDENNWIDESDPIFSKLMVWMNPSGSPQELISLKEAGVGAISLSSSNTLFNLKTSSNSLIGQVAASGIFLTEKGEVKSLQDLNFTIGSKETGSTSDEDANDGDEESDHLLLHSIIAAKRRELELMVQRRRPWVVNEDDNKSLRDKFWEWQKERLS